MRKDLFRLLGLAAVLMSARTAPADSNSFTIIANPGQFGDIEKAAVSENQVNWRDKDLRDDAACTESFAAVELRRYLAACTKTAETNIRLSGPASLPAEGHVFLLGTGPSNPLLGSVNDPGGECALAAAAEAFRIRSFARDSRRIVTIRGHDRVGTLYGVYTYLKLLGMRFYGLGEQGTVYPAGPVSLPENLDVAQKPNYITRGFWPWLVKADADFYVWMARNRLNLWTPEEDKVPLMKKLGLRLIHGGHIIQYACLYPPAEYPYKHAQFTGGDGKPADPYPISPAFQGDVNKDGKLSYFEAHPEWYSLQKGKRSNRMDTDGGDNYCMSNKDATHELCINLVRVLADGQWRDVDLLLTCTLDGGRYCECDTCKQLGTFTDQLFFFVQAIQSELKKAQADGRLARTVKLVPAAYTETIAPPSKPLPPDFDYENCCVELAPIERTYAYAYADPRSTKVNQRLLGYYLKWTSGENRTYKGSMFISEYYNVSSFASLPLVWTKILAADIPWYYRNGTRHFNYMHTPLRLWGTWALNQHLMAELLWDVNADAGKIAEEFYARYYPTASKHAKVFYENLEAMSSNMKSFKHNAGDYSLRNRLHAAVNDKKAALFPREDLQYFPNHVEKNDGLSVVEIVAAVRRARQAIDDALIVCTDTTERQRLVEAEKRFAYGEAVVMFYYHTIRTVMFDQKGDEPLARLEFQRLEKLAARLEQITDMTHSAGEHANFKNGLLATQIDRVYDTLKGRYGGAPSTSASK